MEPPFKIYKDQGWFPPLNMKPETGSLQNKNGLPGRLCQVPGLVGAYRTSTFGVAPPLQKLQGQRLVANTASTDIDRQQVT